MNDPITLRQQVRSTLAALPSDERACEEFILLALNRFFTKRVQVPEMKAALAWNQERGWIDCRYDRDRERDEWFITAKGRVKEGL